MWEKSVGKDDEVDGETCSKSCQDRDADGSEFLGLHVRVVLMIF